jgi:hypothetical protein
VWNQVRYAGWVRPRRRWLLLALVLAIVACAAGAAAASASEAAASAYSFTPIASLGDPAPGGGAFTFDFEPSAVNGRGDVAFVADLTSGVEGVFVTRAGRLSQLARGAEPAPGGGVFSFAELGRVGLDDAGDASFAFTLDPFTTPVGLNAGVYRFSKSSQALSALLRPGAAAPGGGTFQGTYFNTGINNGAETVFSGIITGGDIDPSSPPGYMGMGTGLFRADKAGQIVAVVRPGDPAPGGRVFDSAINGSINDGGEIAFGGHVAGDECVDIGSPLVCGESVYLRSSTSGTIRSVAHQGGASPCAGTPYRTAFGPLVNGRGDIAFIGDLTPPPNSGSVTGVFLFSRGAVIPVACPGVPLPGGGTMASAGSQDATYSLNNQGQVSFAAVLNTDDNSDGVADSGVYLFSNGSTSVVARTGTTLPGVGTIATVGLFPGPPTAQAGGVINDRGQVLFSATLTDGKVVLLLATPSQ